MVFLMILAMFIKGITHFCEWSSFVLTLPEQLETVLVYASVRGRMIPEVRTMITFSVFCYCFVSWLENVLHDS